MNEIDLKKTPLSEIDLSKIDYEKSFIEDKDFHAKHHIKHIKSCEHGWFAELADNRAGFTFRNNGKDYFCPTEFILHLFYKEEKRL